MSNQKLRRGLRPYQLSMISIGGVIGVGMFLGAGATVSLAGPAVILAYALGGSVMFAVMLMREMQYDSGLVFERVVGYRKGFCLWGEAVRE